ncbi:hypothetical protein MAM1_0673d11108 [Mucor ambiguus]|uniref:Uncharacterized protein n=1 Tax=Mucor ambiguus TaxID=91626 RepID=A0A0C9N647_9FUNG|nr:hypothetical protein MAM1_0673d11108 [Mucor ambiguus]
MNATATARIPVVCSFCGIEEYFRRNHRDRTATTPASAVSENNGNTDVVCSLYEPSIITVAAPNSVTCPHCGREGHLRRSHSNYAMNFIAQNRVSYLNIARDPELPEEGHTSMASPVFQACCAAGQAILRQLTPLPEQIVNLRKNNDAENSIQTTNMELMHEVNPFVDLLKSMEELSSEREGGMEDIRMMFRAENAPSSRRYNDPTADEVASGDDDECCLEPRNRDIVGRFKGVGGNEGFSRISELSQHYDALHYVLRNLDTFET